MTIRYYLEEKLAFGDSDGYIGLEIILKKVISDKDRDTIREIMDKLIEISDNYVDEGLWNKQNNLLIAG